MSYHSNDSSFAKRLKEQSRQPHQGPHHRRLAGGQACASGGPLRPPARAGCRGQHSVRAAGAVHPRRLQRPPHPSVGARRRDDWHGTCAARRGTTRHHFLAGLLHGCGWGLHRHVSQHAERHRVTGRRQQPRFRRHGPSCHGPKRLAARLAIRDHGSQRQDTGFRHGAARRRSFRAGSGRSPRRARSAGLRG